MQGNWGEERVNSLFFFLNISVQKTSSETGFGDGHRHQPSCPSLPGRCPVHRFSQIICGSDSAVNMCGAHTLPFEPQSGNGL